MHLEPSKASGTQSAKDRENLDYDGGTPLGGAVAPF